MTASTVERRPLSLGTIILVALAVLGLVMMVGRWGLGLGATTALDDGRGWGLWISFDLLSGISLAAGAFTIAAVVHIFNLKRFYPLLRPAILTGFLGYVLEIAALLVDLGFPHRLWHIFIYPNIHSPLYLVGWAVLTYTTVMALELSPLVFERFSLEKPLRVIKALTVPLAFLAAMISVIHQSTLGTLFIASPTRVHPLLYSPLLPIYFFASAVGVGIAMMIVESTISSRVFKRHLELDLLSDLSRALPYILGLYFLLKVGDLAFAGEFGYLFTGDLPSILYLVELTIGVIAPMVLFALPSVRGNQYRLFWTAVLVILGLVLNRFNVSLIGFDGTTYLPSFAELTITIGLVSMGLIAFGLAVKYLKVFPDAEKAQ
jgi:Ni/Fe-hydrogenase subunit HybB-like protein